MKRQLHKLSVKGIDALSSAGRHSDGGGLYLSITAGGARRWVFLFRWNGKPTEMGLGSAVKGAVSLAQARAKAAEARSELRAGRNPLEVKRAMKADRKVEDQLGQTFGQVADAYVEAMSPQWRNAKHRAQWTMTLTRYCAPIRGKKIEEVSTEDVVAVLRPLWQRTPETAERLRGRIENVMDAAKARGLRSGENPARWRGHLDLLLPRRQRLSRGHHAALPFRDMADFMAALRCRESVASLALEFCILTAARSGEVLGATWAEVDQDRKLWTVPASRMKGGREHRVPLCPRAIAILEVVGDIGKEGYLFPSQRQGKPLSNMAMAMQLRRMKRTDITVHGFRSTFRDWVWEQTEYPRDLAEQALAHVLGDKTEAAYRRGDALERRRKMMEDWESWCGYAPQEPATET